jgi:hypothetical protein
MRKLAFLPGALMVVSAVLWAGFMLRWTVSSFWRRRPAPASAWRRTGACANGPETCAAFTSHGALDAAVAALGLVNALAGIRAVTFG